MKLKVKLKRFTNSEGHKVNLPQIIKKGDWIDLYTLEEVTLSPPQAGTLKGSEAKKRDVISEVTYIPLGVAIQLPAGFEAIIAPRSSTPKKLGVICANAIGIIDNSYKGNDDQWMFPAIAIRKTHLSANTRICQFRIQLSQKATLWQKMKWFLASGIEIVEVDDLSSDNRGGFGSTGNV